MQAFLHEELAKSRSEKFRLQRVAAWEAAHPTPAWMETKWGKAVVLVLGAFVCVWFLCLLVFGFFIFSAIILMGLNGLFNAQSAAKNWIDEQNRRA